MSEKRSKAIRIAKELRRMYPRVHVFLDHSNTFELLVAVVLSAQCTDKKVNEVTKILFKKYKKLDDYIIAGATERGRKLFEQDIRSTGFYRTKTKHILELARRIKKQFKGKVPQTMEELITLPGVGRKTANIILESAFGVVMGIPVDTHVFRLSHVLGLSRANTPEKVEKDLCNLLPKQYWPKFSYRMIAYGREYCPAKKHNHALCPLSRIKV